jgi:hypothetical protein
LCELVWRILAKAHHSALTRPKLHLVSRGPSVNQLQSTTKMASTIANQNQVVRKQQADLSTMSTQPHYAHPEMLAPSQNVVYEDVKQQGRRIAPLSKTPQ